MHTSRRLLFVMVALAALLAIPVSASAYAPGADDFIECVLSGERGVDCIGGFFDPGTDVDVLVETNPVLLDTTVTANEDGEVAFSFTVPDDIGDATIQVTLTGTQNGAQLVLVDDVALVSDGEVLPITGASSLGLVAMAIAALVIGGGILLVARRRDTTLT